MVFVGTIMVFTLSILSVVLALFILIKFISGNIIYKENFQTTYSLNIFYNFFIILILVFLGAFLSLEIFSIICVFGLVIFYFQPNSLTLWVEKLLTETALLIRKKSLGRLLLENCTITASNAYGYIVDLIKSEASNFAETTQDSIQDVQVGFFLKKPSNNNKQTRKIINQFQSKFFKYKKIGDFTYPEIKTTEDLIKANKFWKNARDPRKNFNFVSRLPYTFKYTVNDSNFKKYLFQNILTVYSFFKSTAIALLLAVIYFIYTIFFFKIQFLKQISVWFVIGMIYFWLMSGFNFFLKRYNYGKFTSQIQRFWKRTNMVFWIIEGFLILLFFYYFLNSSQEPLYMYDYSAINQEYLISLHVVGVNVILLSVVIYFMYFTILRLNSNSWTQLNLYLILISVFIFFSFFIETYQFYYVVSTFNERLWFFNEEDNLWVLDIDNPILRTKHQYLLVCLIAKYWHFLFIFLSWVFFLIKSYERRKVTYVLFGANLQNMIILYALNLACYLQWFKWIYRRFFDLPYTWFMTNIDNKFVFRLFSEIQLVLTNLVSFNSSFANLNNIVYKSLITWNVDSICMWKFL